MTTKKLTLDEILAQEDGSGLLDVKSKVGAVADEASRTRSQFEEINAFVDRHGFAPGLGPKEHKIGIAERTLQARLRAFSESPGLRSTVAGLDRHRLLESPSSEPATLDEILDSDDDLLSDSNSDLFNMRYIRSAPSKTDMVSERVKCQDFDAFKPLFDKAAAELASGERRSIRFANEQDIEAGSFFILNGVMVYVAEVRDPHVRNGKRNARLRLIFDNGTEGNNLLRSLATELYKDPNGRRISDPNPGPLFGAPTNEVVREASPKERVTGLVYVVRSLSTQPEIARLDGQLFKIGFTTGSLETRLRTAADDPTFLMAPVAPVMSYEAINLNVNAFERILHHLFAEARLDIEIQDRFGKPIKPREWFLLPLSIIEQAVPMIVDGTILGYRYDHRACALEKG
ncbi:GIY-YIG nuclease family protein [Burkholderia stabilis]|uniref:GIY-YIG nuclease family protein n=1 Tax=Burkholderia stabilis TaxID=95485 RepID=UPI001F4A9002|nr:GIY-YIG nuclease family protein [Burkholderia stabilis]